MKIYIDGNIAAQGTPSYTGIKNTTDRTNFPRIGATYDNGEFFDGEIGPVLVYNRALTALEVSQNYNQLKPRFT